MSGLQTEFVRCFAIFGVAVGVSGCVLSFDSTVPTDNPDDRTDTDAGDADFAPETAALADSREEIEEVSDDNLDLSPCTDAVDCPGGYLCWRDQCREACGPADPCAGPLRSCYESAGICEECIANSDCSAAEQCVNRTCEFFCRVDEDCPQPLYCDFSSGTCFEAECLNDDDCSGGSRCSDLRCVPLDTPDVECASDSDCAGGYFCDEGLCLRIAN